jgi:hydrogenase/urease accessory protein HupE
MSMITLARRTALSVPLLLATGGAFAHPGHDTAPVMGFFEGLQHMLSSPYHLGMLLGAVVVGVAGACAWRASRAQRSHRG